MKTHTKTTPAMLALCAMTLAYALQPAPLRAGDAIADAFFAPELIMQAQDALGVTEEQKNNLRESFEKTQQHMQQLQEQLKGEVAKLTELANQAQVEEKAALTQADKILDVEREIKHAQLTLLVQIKNSLTPEQQARL